jgi:diguanylate cyclase (GGDEF)-like protein
MTPLHTSLPDDRKFAWWQPPGPALAHAGRDGERLLANVRLALIGALCFVPLSSIALHPEAPHNVTALVALLLGAVAGLLAWLLARRGDPPRGLGFLTAVTDITLISATQVAYLWQGLPSAAVHSRTTFSFYLLAIVAASLRYDRRIVWLAGALAVLQYGGVVVAASMAWSAMGDGGQATYGAWDTGHQVGRLILLVAATMLADAIVRQSSHLRHSSTHDALTGLANREFFAERLGLEAERAQRYGRPLSVAMLDLDRFKAVNDAYGHPAGDRVLRHAAQVMLQAVRRSDLVARIGGEEFVVVFPETDAAAAAGLSERLRDLLAATPAPLGDGRTTPLTVTIGVAAAPADGDRLDALLAAADRRLYEGKRAGRNRVISAGASSGTSATSATPRASRPP